MDSLSKQNEHNVTRPIIYMNNPLDSEEGELLGYSSQLVELEDAIINRKAKVIGVLGSHGIGKSSVIRCLCNRLNQRHVDERELSDMGSISGVLEERRGESKLIEINLWENSDFTEVNTTQPISRITKSFLFQFALGLEDKDKKSSISSKHVNRLISSSYGMISASINNYIKPMYYVYGIGVVAIFVLWKYLTFHLIQNPEIEWSSSILYLSQSFANIAGTVFVVLIGILLLASNLKISFSSWKSEGRRNPELGDVYEILEDFAVCLKKKNKRHSKKQMPGYILVSFEDFDRIENTEVIVQMLKDIKGYASFFNKREIHNIIFLMAAKPADALMCSLSAEDCSRAPELQNLYSKIFDFHLELRPIHHEDSGVILLKLLQEKKADILYLTQKKSIGEIGRQLRWLTQGENLNIRRIKERLNLCFSLYRSLIVRNNSSDMDIRLQVCAAVAYLKESYPLGFSMWEANEYEVSRFIREERSELYSKKTYNYDEKAIKLNGILTTENNKPEKGFTHDIIDLIAKRLIDPDTYRMYFYTYPKGGRIYTSSESLVRDLLYHNNGYQDFQMHIKEINMMCTNPRQRVMVSRWLDEIASFKAGLPQGIIASNELLNIAIRKDQEAFLRLMLNLFQWGKDSSNEYLAQYHIFIKQNFDNRSFVLDRYFKEIVRQLEGQDITEIQKIRLSIAVNSMDYCNEFSILYSDESMPAISAEELNSFSDASQFINCIATDKIDEEVCKIISDKVNLLYKKERKLEFDTIISKCFDVCNDKKNMAKQFLIYLQASKGVDTGRFDEICRLEAVTDKEILEYVNGLPVELIPEEYFTSLENVRELFSGYKDTVVARAAKVGALFFYLMSTNMNKKGAIHINLSGTDATKFIATMDQVLHYKKERFDFIRQGLSEQQIQRHKLYDVFQGHFPLINNSEINNFSRLRTLFKCVNQVEIDLALAEKIAEYINKKHAEKGWFALILGFVISVGEKGKTVEGKRILENIDFTKIKIKDVSVKIKESLYGRLKDIVDLHQPEEAIEFIRRTEFGDSYLIQIISDKCFDEEAEDYEAQSSNRKTLFDTIAGLSFADLDTRSVKHIYNMIQADEFEHPLWVEVEQELYSKGEWREYYISRILREGKLKLNNRRLLEHIECINEIYLNKGNVAHLLENDKDFLIMIRKRGIYGKYSLRQLLPMAKIEQTHELITYILFNSTFSSEEKIKYLASIPKELSKDTQEKIYDHIKQLPHNKRQIITESKHELLKLFSNNTRKKYYNWLRNNNL